MAILGVRPARHEVISLCTYNTPPSPQLCSCTQSVSVSGRGFFPGIFVHNLNTGTTRPGTHCPEFWEELPQSNLDGLTGEQEEAVDRELRTWDFTLSCSLALWKALLLLQIEIGAEVGDIFYTLQVLGSCSVSWRPGQCSSYERSNLPIGAPFSACSSLFLLHRWWKQYYFIDFWGEIESSVSTNTA